jgi:hypothetical protein
MLSDVFFAPSPRLFSAYVISRIHGLLVGGNSG